MINIKSLLFGLLLLIIGTKTFGQTNKFDIGVEVSPSLASLRGNDLIDNRHKPAIGFLGGFFFQYNFKKTISVRTNIAYERKGSVSTGQITDNNGNLLGEVTYNTKLDYLTFPILVRATFGKKAQFFVNAGPYFGYLLKQTFVTKGDNIPTTTQDNTSLNKRFDLGISTSLGLSVPIKEKLALSFEMRNNLGLYNISRVPVVNDGTIKTNSINVLFGIAYKLEQRTSRTKNQSEDLK